jgi:hypothetical protein
VLIRVWCPPIYFILLQIESYYYTPFLVYIVASAAWFTVLTCWMRSNSANLKKFAWGVSGGSLTGYQNFLKDSLTLLKAKESVPVELLFGLVVGAIMTSFCGLLLLTACMKRYDATYSSTMFVGSFVIAASIMSAVHYDTFHHLSSRDLFLYPTGLVILMSGVFLLIRERKQQTRPIRRIPSAASIGSVRVQCVLRPLPNIHFGD